MKYMLVSAIGLAVVALVVAVVVLFFRARGDTPQPAGIQTEGFETTDDGGEIPPAVAQAMKQVVMDKSVALDNATTSVHRAHDHTGPTMIQPNASAKTIAVDVTFSGYTAHFKPRDVDIIDAKTTENFGSDAEIAFLDAAGHYLSRTGEGVDFSKPIRLLMVFAVPKSTDSIRLGYWGRELTKKPVWLESHGMALPARAETRLP
jgi:hypothetical protein